MKRIGTSATIAFCTALALLTIFNTQLTHAQTSDKKTPTAITSDLKNTESESAKNEPPVSTSHLDLGSNECLKTLNDQDVVIASIAFKDGVSGFNQLVELVKRKPWGTVTADAQKEIENQILTQSPFLIVKLTKKQTLKLDEHRDIILWVLVQSTTQACK